MLPAVYVKKKIDTGEGKGEKIMCVKKGRKRRMSLRLLLAEPRKRISSYFAVTHPNIGQVQRFLTSVISREPMLQRGLAAGGGACSLSNIIPAPRHSYKLQEHYSALNTLIAKLAI